MNCCNIKLPNIIQYLMLILHFGRLFGLYLINYKKIVKKFLSQEVSKKSNQILEPCYLPLFFFLLPSTGSYKELMRDFGITAKSL